MGWHQARRWLKWFVTALGALVAALLIYGRQHATSLRDGREFEIRLIADHLVVFWGPSTSWSSLSTLSWSRHSYSCVPFVLFALGPPPAPPISRVLIPLWWLLFALSAMTVILWWFDRRRTPPGHCQKCGHDLAGNVSRRCPECGTVIDADPPPLDPAPRRGL